MKKRYFWALQKGQDKVLIIRFRSEHERTGWIQNATDAQGWGLPPIYRIAITGTDPEVRRIQRQIKQGENIQFPTEV